jgi:alpha-L-fucosidase 2
MKTGINNQPPRPQINFSEKKSALSCGHPSLKMKGELYNRILVLTICSLLMIPSCTKTIDDPNLKLWYDRPATIWEEALPLGNGKTGAMVFGGVVTERFQLNDLTLWSGYPEGGNNPDGPEILKKTRDAVFKGDYAQAGEEWKKIHGPYSARYLPMGDLFIKMHLDDTTATEYYRDLNIQKAISTVSYKSSGIRFTREAFVSYPGKAVVINLTASKKNSLTFDISLSGKLRFVTESISDNVLILKGKAPYHVAHRNDEPVQVGYNEKEGEGTNFEIKLKCINSGGTIKAVDNKIVVSGADKVVIYVAGATSYNGFDKSPGLAGKDPAIETSAIIESLSEKTIEEIRSAHLADFRKLFDRVTLNIGAEEEALMLPTDDRLIRFGSGKSDLQLQSLYFQFGRYLLISSSRDQQMPANLQGLWNDKVQPSWGSNYTTNINTEMNYWLAENTNLSECHTPLLNFISSLAVNGAKTAKTNFGLDGWCVFHNSDIWAKTSPAGGGTWDPRGAPRWSCWPMGGAWFSQHLFRHYEYTGDEKFLRETAWPLMKGASDFLLGWLVENPDGYLVTNPSTSPENTFKIDGKTLEVSIATTMDMAITRDIFTNCIRTLEILNIEPDYKARLADALKRLYPYHIGQYGQLQEWFLDLDNPEDNHRHLSHLFGLYPGSQISPVRTPELAAAAKQSMIHRGDISTGWSMAWKINWWARLEDGDHAHKILKAGLTYIGPKNPDYKGGGTYPNLFDGHPPFQIDGNFGGTAGIAEMLLQCYDGYISLLPALPSEWSSGNVKGLKAKGGFTIDMDWANSSVNKITVLSVLGGNCRIRTKIPVKVVEVKSSKASGINPNTFYSNDIAPVFINNSKVTLQETDVPEGYIIDFSTEKGKSYTIIPV